MIDGSPSVYTVPTLFMESFQSADDYNIRPFYASLIRSVRLLSFVLTSLLPATFVALTTFHQELIPTPLLITISAASDRTPFPAAIEIIGMGFVFEILREAGLRMPRPFGPAVSIVGGLVIGEATVGAGLIGEPTVIVIALTAISSYVVFFQAEVSVFIRLGLVIFAGFFGLYGILLGTFLTVIHLASLRSFGVPYLSPLGPLMKDDLKDTLFRVPYWAMINRPSSLEPQDQVRQKKGLRPQSPGNKKD
jgi:spore germination protein KA